MKFDAAKDIDIATAQSIIRDIAASGMLISSKHAKERMVERGYTMSDVQYILMYGEIVRKEFKEENNNWAYTIHGADLEGDEGGVITAIISPSKCVVITVLS